MPNSRLLQVPLLLCLASILVGCAGSNRTNAPRPTYTLPHVNDFEVTGTGDAPAWQQAPWADLTVLKGPAAYRTRAKGLYSDKGIYVLFDCEDTRLTTPFQKDFDDLYDGDVAEVFLWPDPRQRAYFEYEISPLGPELPLMVVNNFKRYQPWLPFHYAGEKRTRRATAVRGGRKGSGAAVAGWSAEVFIPFELLTGLTGVPPQPGDRWRANFYRIDYDRTEPTFLTWSPLSKVDYHRIREFGTLRFGPKQSPPGAAPRSDR